MRSPRNTSGVEGHGWHDVTGLLWTEVLAWRIECCNGTNFTFVQSLLAGATTLIGRGWPASGLNCLLVNVCLLWRARAGQTMAMLDGRATPQLRRRACAGSLGQSCAGVAAGGRPPASPGQVEGTRIDALSFQIAISSAATGAHRLIGREPGHQHPGHAVRHDPVGRQEILPKSQSVRSAPEVVDWHASSVATPAPLT